MPLRHSAHLQYEVNPITVVQCYCAEHLRDPALPERPIRHHQVCECRHTGRTTASGADRTFLLDLPSVEFDPKLHDDKSHSNTMTGS